MRIYILSNGINALTQEQMTSSSSKYELNLAKSLSRLCDVEILSTKLPYGKCIENGHLKLKGIKCKTRTRFQIGKYKKIKAVINASQTEEDKAFIFWGYEPHMLLALLQVKRKCKLCLVPFIYDYHWIAIKDLGALKRRLVDIYFKLGFSLVRNFDRFLFFQKNAAKELRVTKPYLVSKPGIIPHSSSLPIHSEGEKFKVAFCGTLTELNGIDILLEAVPELVDRHIELHIYGEGPLKTRAMEADKRYDIVEYHGVVSDQELRKVYQNSDLLLNLRRLDDYAMNFCFPSKLFECIESGCPVLTTKVLDDEKLNCNVTILDNACARDVAKAIIKLSKNRELAREQARKAKEYIEKKYSYDNLSKEIFEFLVSGGSSDKVAEDESGYEE